MLQQQGEITITGAQIKMLPETCCFMCIVLYGINNENKNRIKNN